jgi:hypothetical protein
MPTQAKSVNLGMGERGDVTFTINGSVPVIAVTEVSRAMAS